MNAHTPGPWRYMQRGTQVWGRSVGGCQMEESNHLVADIRGWGHLQYLPNGSEVQDANGHLIAAAPQLLQALIDIAGESTDAGARECARAAISKATGGAA